MELELLKILKHETEFLELRLRVEFGRMSRKLLRSRLNEKTLVPGYLQRPSRFSAIRKTSAQILSSLVTYKAMINLGR